ncbi:MAG: hypothetical protein DI536_12715 [Archangium gephyra]|uniref:Bacteriocin-protection protein n=1 Tax=Archangium gephyra TaxID=48 RepID=A0A2W5TJY8_9BACT|nr:MAG: hypothetical protein DI536_12715 [Archangium gephyra]
MAAVKGRAKKAGAAAEYPKIEVGDRARLRAWLSKHHATSSGVWLVMKKRDAGGVLRWNDVVEEVLCFGWVDSLPRALDDAKTMLLVTPRNPRSNWSAKNTAHVADLERRQLMTPAGRAAVETAKRNGAWTALDAVSALEVPSDLDEALRDAPDARTNWEAFPPSARREILEWIASAKKTETRARRVSEVVRLARQNVRANQWPRAR